MTSAGRLISRHNIGFWFRKGLPSRQAFLRSVHIIARLFKKKAVRLLAGISSA
jgi:hypothetical protein